MTFYIAGPMSGYPLWNFPAFDSMRDYLKASGHEVISPADLDREHGFSEHRTSLEGFDIEAAIRRDIDAIFKCDAVLMLEGWEKSKGATAEYHLAKWLGKQINNVIKSC
jgi:hypothetical protein